MQKNNLLTPLESLIYNRIKFFTEQGEYKYCSQSNGTLSTYFSRPKESISRTISKLKRLGYITEERDGTLRKLMSTSKENIFNYAVNIDEEVVKENDEVVKENEEVVKVSMTKSLISVIKSLMLMTKSLSSDDEVVIDAMRKSLRVDEEVVKHNIKILIKIFNKDINLKENNNNIIIKEKKIKDIWTEEEILAFEKNLNKKLEQTGLKDFDRKFCQDILNKLNQYGKEMLITDKQLIMLETVFN